MISLGGIVVSQSIRVGGDEMDDAIVNYVKREYKLMIGQQTAEEIKLEIGSAFPLEEEVQAEVRGRDLVSGLPKTVVLTSEEVRSALEEPLAQIIGAVKETLDRTPPELASDIMDRGIMLAGGGALLQGLDERLRDETQMPCHLAESPLTCVAVGSGRSLEEFEAIHRANQKLPQPQATLRSASGQSDRARIRPSGEQKTSTKYHFPCTRNRFAGDERCWRCSSRLSIALLTAYFGESAVRRPARDPARLPGGDGAAPGRRQPRAEARARLGGWVGDVFDAKSENKELRARSSGCAPSWRRPQTGSARRRAAARAGRLQPLDRASRPATSRVGARVIGRSPTVWYSTITIDKGSDQGVHVDQPVVNGDGLVGKVSDVSRRRCARHADHRSHERRLGPGGSRRRQRPRQGEGRRSLRPDPRLRPEGPAGAARARRWSPRAGARRASSRCSRAASRSASVTRVGHQERELYQRVHLRPFADLRSSTSSRS